MKRRSRRLLRQETLAPWVAMAVILGGWALAARLIAPATPRLALAGPSEAVDAAAEVGAPPADLPAQARAEIATGTAEPPPQPPAGTSGVGEGPTHDVTEDLEVLRGRNLLVPVSGIERRTLVPSFGDARGGGSRPHEALDIMAPRGTPVVAADNGTVAKLFESKRGGTTIYQFDPSGTYCYYYAHLDRYAPDVKPGVAIERGQVIGYVGSSGNASADAPHLHFAIFRLGPEQRWWEGAPLDPYLVLH